MNTENRHNIPEEFLRPYSPTESEPLVYQTWETSGFFNPDICIEKGVTKADAEHFSIVLPPPNVTGTLHTGHALMLVIQDIMVRYQRMLGKKTLWIPGTDHAAIATQSKVEKLLEKEGLKKHDLGREAFLKRVEQFAQESHDTIVHQTKKMGASLDWSREAYTLDDKRNLAVRTAFKKMYDDGLIYRGHRIVNWDPKGQTTISDDELVYQEETVKFYYFKYGPFTIGTARPETKFGDKYVVMHPDDARYAQYNHGDKLTIEWINGPLEATIIKDSMIDMEFGTGVMTITPWHSKEDFDLAEKYNLDKEQIIDQYGKLLPIAGEFAGMKIKDAREKIVEKLQSKGLVEKVEENYKHNIATAERSGGIIEPQIMHQWFIDVNKPIAERNNKSLKELMQDAVNSKNIEIIPDRFEKIYFHWINNLKDWCISRQIWYGHQIPVWYKGEETYVGIEAPLEEGWVQDPDTLDTWFSSGLWTFSTLGWPEQTTDLETYHPTSVLETGHDILFFWIARMILMSTYVLGTVPFKTVYLHGMVRAANGQKMSKSLGNAAADPLDIIAKYGNDALRMAMIIGNTPGNDLKLDENNIRGYGKFGNKIWNATRFVLESIAQADFSEPVELDSEDQQSMDELNELLKVATKEMNEFKFSLAGDKLYHYFWHTFADIIIERSKKKITEGINAPSAQRLLYLQHLTLIKALHPFMPFVTEKVWGLLPKIGNETNDNKLLIIESWPTSA
ncbi:MAG: valine--tRNA ligase [bacterium]